MAGDLSVEILSSLLEIHPKPTIAVALEGTLLSWNKAANDVCSIIASEENRNANFFTFLKTSSKKELEDVFSIIRQKGTIEKVKLCFSSSDSTCISANVIISHWRFFGTEGFSLVFQDTTGTTLLDQAFAYSLDQINKPVEKVEQIVGHQGALSAAIQAQEVERRRLAESLHNSVGQILYGAKMKAKSFQHPGSTLPEKSTLMAEISELLDEAIKQTKSIAFELLPSILHDFGLCVAIEELVRRIVPATIETELDLQVWDKRYTATLEIGVYRIVQELLNNIIKHAQSTALWIVIKEQNGILEVEVSDNGIGYIQKPLGNRITGLGLLTIQDRIRILGGKMQISSTENEGTNTKLLIPVYPG